MDGLTCARRIRELERAKEIVRHVPIIGITANARVEQIASCIEAGMDEVVVSCDEFVTEVLILLTIYVDKTLPCHGSASSHARSCRSTHPNLLRGFQRFCSQYCCHAGRRIYKLRPF